MQTCLKGTIMKKLMDSGYENAYRGNGFSYLNVRIDVEDLGGHHYALSVKMNLTLNHNNRERSASSHSGAFELATAGRDALLNGYAVLFVDEPRRLGQAKRRAATVMDTLAALIVEKACDCVADGDVPAHCLKGDAGILFAYACQE